MLTHVDDYIYIFLEVFTPSVRTIGSILISRFHPSWGTYSYKNTITINLTGGVIIVK